MIYIGGCKDHQCRDYARWLGLKPTEWVYVNRARQLEGRPRGLFIELEGIWKQTEYRKILYEIERSFLVKVRVKW